MRRKREAGSALIFTAIALVAVVGFVGLGIDMGTMRYQKRLQQTAADAAAIAGATNLTYGGVQTGAQNASATNGFADNSGGGACGAPPTNLAVGSIAVTVCNGPSTGPHTGDANYVEAFVSVGQPTYFMKIFGVDSRTITSRAVATNFSGATNGGTNNACLISLGAPSSSIEGVNINGNATLNATTCGIIDNGNYNSKGNALIVNAGSFGVSGSANVSGPGGTVTCSSGQTNCPQYGAPAAMDPLARLTPPVVGAPVNWTGNAVPGTTYNGISIQSNANVDFPSGTYVISGGSFVCHGTPTITGTGVTFYFTNGATFNCSGNDTIQFSAPSSGPYADILFYQDPNDTAGASLGGNTGATYNGILYFPKAPLTFFGNNTSLSTGVVIADSVSLSGHPTVNLQGASSLPGGGLPPGFTVGTATLVE
jgi:Flp pilus assembly protein TadG